jgi:hypothetical protein
MIGRYLLASAVGALVLPTVAYLSDNFEFVGGSLVAVPFLDLLVLLFITVRNDAANTLVGDIMGQIGAFTAIFAAFILVRKTQLSIPIIVAICLSSAMVFNAMTFVFLKFAV